MRQESDASGPCITTSMDHARSLTPTHPIYPTSPTRPISPIRSRLVITQHHQTREHKRRGGARIWAGFPETLQRAVAPDRPDGAAESLERAGGSLHFSLLLSRRGVADQRDERRIAQTHADTGGNE